MSLYVLADIPIFNNHNKNDFHVRTIIRNNKSMVVACDNKTMLNYIKDKKDDYYAIEIDQSLLKNYCKQNNLSIFYISECHCSLEDKKQYCKTVEIDNVNDCSFIEKFPGNF